MMIEYRPGAQNYEADLLSRMTEDGRIFLIQQKVTGVTGDLYVTSARGEEGKEEEKFYFINDKVKTIYPTVENFSRIKLNEELAKAQREDPDFKPIIDHLKDGWMPEDEKEIEKLWKIAPKFELHNNLLYRVDLTPRMIARGVVRAQICVPEPFREDVLKLCHSSIFGGHLGVKKTYKKIQNDYYWPKLTASVGTWIRNCLDCEMRKSRPMDNVGLSGHLTANAPFDVVSCDIMGPLTTTERGNRYIVVFIDHFARYIEAFAIPKQDSEAIADLFVRSICCRHGVPKQFLSDRGKQIIGQVMTAIHAKLGVNQLTTSSYRPQANGVSERANKTIIAVLFMFVSDHQKRLGLSSSFCSSRSQYCA